MSPYDFPHRFPDDFSHENGDCPFPTCSDHWDFPVCSYMGFFRDFPMGFFRGFGCPPHKVPGRPRSGPVVFGVSVIMRSTTTAGAPQRSQRFWL